MIVPSTQKLMTHFTKENLYELWNALEYTRETLSCGYYYPSMEGKIDYFLIHKSRADSSYEFLNRAIELINEMKAELREESK